MRHALLGGSFDPLHSGHLWLVEAALGPLACDRVWVVPAARPPHKPGRPLAEFRHRLAMCRAALEGRVGVVVSECEALREGPSYTIDTLRALAAEAGPATEWQVLIGSDMAAEFPAWRDPAGIRALARLAVAARPGTPLPPELGDAIRLPGAPPDISATEVRRRVAAGEPIDALVPPAVARYIQAHALYRPP